MNINILHSGVGRLRVKVDCCVLRYIKTNQLSVNISDIDGVKKVSINRRLGTILVLFDSNIISHSSLLDKLSAIDLGVYPANPSGDIEKSIVWSYIGYHFVRFMQPVKLRPYLTLFSSVPYIFRALKYIIKTKMDVGVLDASAIFITLLQKDFSSASTLMMLLKTGDYLESWARERSTDSLVETLSLNIGNVWVKSEDGEEKEIHYSTIQNGDRVVIRMGSLIPVDGVVVSGEALVNESSLTGEPLPVMKSINSTVHAGTVVEEGEILVKVLHKGDDTRFQKIIALIQDSEARKAEVETRASELADKVVPFNFAVAALVFLFTRNLKKASAALTVDYSCALKLTTPLVFLSVMREGLSKGVFFKGGAPMESLSSVDTIVFDKTGTLTKATPEVVKVIPYNGYTEEEVIKISACLEEHFPHPVARSVVEYSMSLNIEHKEEHNKIKYIVAHGIATDYKGLHTVIGSKHFINEDEKIDVSLSLEAEDFAFTEGYSMLYLAQDGKLAGVFYINDPVREEASVVIDKLRKLGVKTFYMLTGDNKRTASRVARALGIDKYEGQVLPADKAEIIKTLRSQGKIVAMVGDGMNDSPAVSASNVGIAMKGGADLAQEISDITLRESSLYPLVTARKLSKEAINKIHYNTVSAIGVNTALMFFSILGLIPSSSSVWLHNLTTIFLSFNSMRNVLPTNEKIK